MAKFDASKLTDAQLEEAEKELAQRRAARAKRRGILVKERSDDRVVADIRLGELTLYNDQDGLNWGLLNKVELESLIGEANDVALHSVVDKLADDIGWVLMSSNDGQCGERVGQFCKDWKHLLRAVQVKEVQDS